MYLKARKAVDYIQDIHLIYGNALQNITMKNPHIRKVENLTYLFIMKLVLRKLTHKLEKNILKQGKAGVISNHA